MAFDSFLNHKCDVYHITQKTESVGFGLEDKHSFSYPDEPDLTEVRCHFNIRGSAGSRNIVQNPATAAPHAEYRAKIKLVFPYGTDIRLNDKIVDKSNGYEYTADIPVQVQRHHMFVMVRRTASQEPIGAENGAG